MTDADIDARLQVEATVPEFRHAWLIAVSPVVSAGAVEPTAEQIATAKTKIDAALKDLEAGKSWDEVAKTVSTDSTGPQSGDLGWIEADDTPGGRGLSDRPLRRRAEHARPRWSRARTAPSGSAG